MHARPASETPGVAWRRLAIVAAGGLVCALLLLAGGRVAVRVRLGADDTAARARIEAAVRSAFAQWARATERTAGAAASAELVGRASRQDDGAAEALFSSLESAQAIDPALTSITVYDALAQPLAWAGRPSELPGERLSGPAGWFLQPGALGVHLIYVSPLVAEEGGRVGTVAVERMIEVSTPADDAADYVFAALASPVSLRLEENPSSDIDGWFGVDAPDGRRLLRAQVTDDDLARTRRRWLRASQSGALMAAAVTVFLLCGPLLARRVAGRDWRALLGVVGCAGAIVAARVLLRLASPADYSPSDVFSGAAYASPLAAPYLSSPFDFLVSGLAAIGLLLLLLVLAESIRRTRLVPRRALGRPAVWLAFLATQLLAGCAATGIAVVHQDFIADTVANTTFDLAHLSLHPWNPARLALQTGLVLWHGVAFGGAVLAFRVAALPWLVPRRAGAGRALTVLTWGLPVLLITASAGGRLALPAVTAGVTALLAQTLVARHRHGSQAFRLLLLTLGLVVPALAWYPVVYGAAAGAQRALIETRYAPQAITQRQSVQRLLQESLGQIDAAAAPLGLTTDTGAGTSRPADSDRAFDIWRGTSLADSSITSSVEVYAPAGDLVSRFAFNLPEDLTTTPRAEEFSCAWNVYEEVSPFFAEERRVLHAGRALCLDGQPGRGAIVVHAMLDYGDLPFLASQNPYVELLRPSSRARDESYVGRDVEYAVYGWSGRPVFSSRETAWELPASVLSRIAESRAGLWTTLRRGTEQYEAFAMNDRGGIYVLGRPQLSLLGHLVNLAELTVLACLAYALLVPCVLSLDFAGGRAASGRALLREIRASFYRKLFLAFVAAAVVPVIALAVLARNYIADQLRTTVEQEAVRTVATAKRVVEDLVLPRTAGAGGGIDDNLMVWVGRLVNQDVNVFLGPRLQATSERNLFASALLGTRTPAPVYRQLQLGRGATALTTNEVAGFTYLVAAAPLTTRQGDGILTVPLTLRQQQIDAQIDALNRRVVLGALLFILAGAGIGYSMAERIADPVNRLTRATRRIAKGDLDARIAETSSDELRRLVEDFNGMARELQRQRAELERTHRLEAWAEMARQVAHEIKNPLTPIQLNAEHLRRVHLDRGQPLSPVLEDCVANIFTQVGLLRTIASEFSSFASTPPVRPVALALAPLVRTIVEPYLSALEGRVRIEVEVPEDLPQVRADQVLVARAITNIVENALHAMPGGGRLRIVAAARASLVDVEVADTGSGMDAAALARAFEPYFSTKVTGTGLGLPIAKRNLELCGGSVSMQSVEGQGTTVTLTLPVA